MEYEKGLSPIIASILLIVLAIAGSLIVYRFFMSTSDILTSNLSYQILDSRMQRLRSGGALIHLVLKNIGSEAFTVESLELSSDGTSWTQIPLQPLPQEVEPGEIITLEGIVQPSSINVEYGGEYIVRIFIRTVGGEHRSLLEVVKAT